MDGTYDALRRHAEKDLAAIRQRLDSGRRMGVKETHRLADIAEKLTRTMDNMDRMEGRRPYSDTRIGYDANITRRRYANNDTYEMVRDAMDVVNRILPHVADDFEWDTDDDVEARRRRGWRPRRTRRGVGRFTQVRGHVRRMPRSEMDDYDDYDDADYDRYDMDYDAEARHKDSRGRFAKNEHDEMRRLVDDARRAADDARRAANEARGDTPVMERHARHNDARYDARHDANDNARNDDATSDRGHRPGPTMRE